MTAFGAISPSVRGLANDLIYPIPVIGISCANGEVVPIPDIHWRRTPITLAAENRRPRTRPAAPARSLMPESGRWRQACPKPACPAVDGLRLFICEVGYSPDPCRGRPAGKRALIS